MTTSISAVALVAVLAHAVGAAAGQTASSEAGIVQNRTYILTETGQEMRYALFVSTLVTATEPAPLIVVLHGSGATPRDVLRAQGLAGNADRRGYVLVAPMGLHERGGFGLIRDGDEPEDEARRAAELSERDVLNVIDIVKKEFRIDTSRVFALGHSMGGAGAIFLAAKHPSLFAAIAGVASSSRANDVSLVSLAKIPVLLMHGQADQQVRATVSRRLAATLQKLGLPARYVEIPGGDHNMTFYRAPAHLDFIFDFFEESTRH